MFFYYSLIWTMQKHGRTCTNQKLDMADKQGQASPETRGVTIKLTPCVLTTPGSCHKENMRKKILSISINIS